MESLRPPLSLSVAAQLGSAHPSNALYYNNAYKSVERLDT